MRALVFDLSLLKYAAAKALGPKFRRAHYGPHTCFSLREVEQPQLPGDDWVLCRPRLTGFCGSDLAAIFFKMSPAMSALSLSAGDSAVFGHETLAEVVSVGKGATGRVKEGDRVVIDPVLGCRVRGERLCRRCEEGEYATCERFGTAMPRGIMLGASPRYPGGFGERMVAHESQLFRVPDGVPDDVAVLAEPLSIGLHAVLRHPPEHGERILVIGGGLIAFGVLWALKELHREANVTLFTVEDHQLEFVRSLGADEAWSPKKGELLTQAAHKTDSRLLRPVLGRPFLSHGFDRVFDCVGTHRSMDDSIRLTRGGGAIVLVGAAGILPSFDWTLLWAKELKLEGTVYYGSEAWKGGRARTFEICLELLQSTRAPLASLVTHHFPLEDYAKLIEANLDRAKSKSMKTVFTI